MDDQLKDMNLDDSLTESLEIEDEKSVSEESGEESDKYEGASAGEKEPPIRADEPDSEAASGIDHAGVLRTEAEPREPVKIEVLPPSQKRTMQERELSLLLKSRGRAFSEALMTIAGTRQRSGRLWLTCGATLLVIALLIVQVYYRHRDLNLGYELSEAIEERESLLEENRKLRIELRVLSRRERLEPLAGKQLGMSPISPDQMLIVTKSDLREDGDGGRLDGLDNVKRIGEK